MRDMKFLRDKKALGEKHKGITKRAGGAGGAR